jgi:hypothetical protein
MSIKSWEVTDAFWEIVEACHSWFNQFRKLTIRYEKLGATHLVLIHLAAAIIALRKIKTKIIYG